MKISDCEIGMRVKCVNALDGNESTVGKYGTLVKIERDNSRLQIGVDFDDRIVHGHSIGGLAEHEYGYCGKASCLEPVKDQPLIPLSDFSITLEDILEVIK